MASLVARLEVEVSLSNIREREKLFNILEALQQNNTGVAWNVEINQSTHVADVEVSGEVTSVYDAEESLHEWYNAIKREFYNVRKYKFCYRNTGKRPT